MKKRRSTKRRRKKTNTRRRYIFKLLTLAIGAFAFAFLIFYFSVKFGAFGELPNTQVLRKIENNTATEVYSADSVLIGKYYLQDRTRIRYENISENVINALIATEDARFFEHNGIDYRSLARVFFKTILLFDRTAGGGSTITQQLAKNLFPRKDHGWLSIPVNKLKEMIVARRLESIYSKEEILTLYLNTVPFGDNVYGIEMASRRFFNKKPINLKTEEAAVLIGMLKANYTYNPRLFPENSLQRRNVVLHQMTRYGYLKNSQYKKLSELPLTLNYRKITHNSGIATYFRQHLRQKLEDWCETYEKPDGSHYNLYTDGLKIYTTINATLQKYAEEVMEKHMAELQDVFNRHWASEKGWESNKRIWLSAIKNSSRYIALEKKGLQEREILKELQKPVPMKIFQWSGEKEVKLSPIDSVKHYLKFLQTGVLAMDPQTGGIKVWVGGINNEYFKYDHVNFNTKRQVGSTFKPLVYAAALEDGMSPCNYISGEQITYTNLSNWSPGNADEAEYEKKYTFKGALTNSVNTVTVRVLEKVGIDNTIALAREVGIRSELPEVASIALGTANISLVEMVTAYAVFANGGRAVIPRFITAITDISGKPLAIFRNEDPPEQVISEENAMIMNTFLQAVVDEGTGSRYRWKYGLKNDLAGKTGTTQSNTDGWFIGYNPQIVVGTWVGADNPSVHFSTTKLGQGANTALPIVAGFFKKMQRDPEFEAVSTATFPEVPNHIQRKINCDPEKEDKAFMEWLFGKKKEQEKKAKFGKEEGTNIFDKIGNLFKKK